MSGDVVVASKRCNDCGKEKNLAEFYKHSTNADRLHGRCKDCARKRARERAAERRALVGEEVWKERQRDAIARYRATSAERRARDREINRARSAAVSRLIELHRAEYDHLLLLEKRARGL